jgi:hypothetical protein
LKFRPIVGLSSQKIPKYSAVGYFSNSYAIQCRSDYYLLSGKSYLFEWPNGAIKPKWNAKGDVVGCGVLLNPEQELSSIFFTVNGILMGRFPS